MAILPILKYPDPILREQSQPVVSFDAELKTLASDMVQTMLNIPGAGLAAPQVGRLSQLIVIAWAENDEEFDDRVLILANPCITSSSGRILWEEGCLSVTDCNEKVIRSEEITVDYDDLEGQPQTLEAEGRRAVILQHEIDHLNGVLFIDHISQLKRDMYKRRLRKMQREADNE